MLTPWNSLAKGIKMFCQDINMLFASRHFLIENKSRKVSNLEIFDDDRKWNINRVPIF